LMAKLANNFGAAVQAIGFGTIDLMAHDRDSNTEVGKHNNCVW
jgi:hypothetical protein